jgi:hypothetical protein
MPFGTQKCIARLEDVVDLQRFKQCVHDGFALPEEGHVRQQVVALCELIEMLDTATLAPVEKIAQALGVRLHGLGVFDVVRPCRRATTKDVGDVLISDLPSGLAMGNPDSFSQPHQLG